MDQMTDIGRILIVGVRRKNLEVLERIVSKNYKDCRVHKIGDADSTFETVATFSPDLVLLDFAESEICDVDFCRRLGDLPQMCDVPIVWIGTPKRLKLGVTRAGFRAVDCLPKPFSRHELLARSALQLQLKFKQDELTRLGEKYSKLYDKSPFMYASIDPITGTIYECNETLIEAIGYSKHEIIGKPVAGVYTDESAELVSALEFTGTVASEADEGVMLKLQHKAGRAIDVRLTEADELDGRGHVVAKTLSWRNITENFQDDSKSRNVKDYLDSVLFHLPVGVAILEGPEFRYYIINQSLADLNGLPVESHLGKRLVDVLPHAKELIIPELKRVMETGVPILNREFDIVLPGNSTSSHLIDWHVPIVGNDQQSKAIVSVVLDATELQETQNSLRQAHKMEALGTLAGGVAHDFNNILAIILANASLGFESVADDSAMRHFQNILSAGKRAAKLIEQILAFSKLGPDRLKPLDLSASIKDSLRMISVIIPANIEIVQDVLSDCPYVMANDTQIQEVVLNLCSNAFYAMRDTGGTLKVSLVEIQRPRDMIFTSSDQQEATCLCLTISDTGPGISPDAHSRIFDPFFTTKEFGKGTGMGLAVVHGIVDKHHAKISVESVEGVGASFVIHFPIHKSLERSSFDESFELRDVSDLATDADKPNPHILIVDDEVELARAYKSFFKLRGFDATVRTSGQEALAVFTEKPDHFDLVITDQSMPKMTGKQLTRRLLEIRKDIPIIISTGFGDDISEEEFGGLGIRYFLKKPIELSYLMHIVEECLKA